MITPEQLDWCRCIDGPMEGGVIKRPLPQHWMCRVQIKGHVYRYDPDFQVWTYDVNKETDHHG